MKLTVRALEEGIFTPWISPDTLEWGSEWRKKEHPWVSIELLNQKMLSADSSVQKF